MPHVPTAATLNIRSAEEKDYPAIEQLLRAVRLPVAGVRVNLQNFLILSEGEKLLGCVGLEIYGASALLRSLAVDVTHQNRGYGKQLYAAVLKKARERGLSQVYLLTETAEKFFTAQGFQVIDRQHVNKGVQSSEEFQGVCPSTATCMRLTLE